MTSSSNGGFLFDFDGVISHSERHTNPAISDVLAQRGFSWQPVPIEIYGGWTWQAISQDVCRRVSGLSETDLGAELAASFEKRVLRSPVLVPGADMALKLASRRGPTGIATGSDRPVVLQFLKHFQLTPYVQHIVSAELYSEPKPSPMCFEMLAHGLQVQPSASTVFEDSLAGVTAGSASGAQVIAIHHEVTLSAAVRARCHRAVPDFRVLISEGFFG